MFVAAYLISLPQEIKKSMAEKNQEYPNTFTLWILTERVDTWGFSLCSKAVFVSSVLLMGQVFFPSLVIRNSLIFNFTEWMQSCDLDIPND